MGTSPSVYLGETKALSTSTRCGVRRSGVDEFAHPQQAPLKLHDETWAGILRNQGLRISQEVEIVPELSRWLVLHVLILLWSHLGQAELFGTCWAGHSWRKQFGLGYGCSVAPSKGRIFCLPLTQLETG